MLYHCTSTHACSVQLSVTGCCSCRNGQVMGFFARSFPRGIIPAQPLRSRVYAVNMWSPRTSLRPYITVGTSCFTSYLAPNRMPTSAPTRPPLRQRLALCYKDTAVNIFTFMDANTELASRYIRCGIDYYSHCIRHSTHVCRSAHRTTGIRNWIARLLVPAREQGLAGLQGTPAVPCTAPRRMTACLRPVAHTAGVAVALGNRPGDRRRMQGTVVAGCRDQVVRPGYTVPRM
jgi:hypothetical protein